MEGGRNDDNTTLLHADTTDTSDMNKKESVYQNLPVFSHIPVAATTTNLGDDIQSYAAAQLFGVANYVDRDNFLHWTSGKIIPFLGWYGYDHDRIPKAQSIFISTHFCQRFMSLISKSPKWIGFIKGCVQDQGFPALTRDTVTRDFIRNLGIPAEFGGCVSSTLPRYEGLREGAISVDVPPDVAVECVAITAIRPHLKHISMPERIEEARKMVEQLARASQVHTSRLHTILPCRALGTPCKFYFYNIYEPHRLAGHNLF